MILSAHNTSRLRRGFLPLPEWARTASGLACDAQTPGPSKESFAL